MKNVRGARARYVGARRSAGIANSFRQRKTAAPGEAGGQYLWSATARHPWKVREENRRRNKIARRSRRAARGA